MPKERSPRRRTAALSVAAVAVLGGAALTARAGVVGPADRTAAAAPAGGTSAPPPARTPPTASAAAPPGSASAAAPTGDPAVFTGLAFDTCTAPAPSAMNAWHGTSPYGAAAVYIGGRNRGCAQPQLTLSWVASVTATGWRLIPLYVGAQPPCRSGSDPEKLTAGTAVDLGSADGADAVAAAGALGMRPGSTLYLDVESYDAADTACAAAVLAYTRSFDRAVEARGYRPGFYGFAASGAAGIARAAADGVPDLPTALWYAEYDDVEDTVTGFPFAAGLFTGHRRGHQYRVDRRETHGGVTLTVDRNAWDAPVAVVG
ncbi:glycoside hydrolase domain-containing protein [Kitasatospora sp. NPDC093679]|uniref:glycoside hydrolase domain-containing protein n=1 Tax=Kitasatospora sp. NPDC093679 TaxID=3154983 RepID=UPI0034393CA1